MCTTRPCVGRLIGRFKVHYNKGTSESEPFSFPQTCITQTLAMLI